MSARSFRRSRQREIERTLRRRDWSASRSKGAIVAGAGLGATVMFAPAADAAQFTVSNLDDAGAGSLRQAVLDANVDSTADEILFQAGLSGTITLTTGELEITEPVSIQGPGAGVLTVSGNDASRIFYIDPNTDGIAVSISGLTLTKGNSPSDDGGALYAHDTKLTISDSAFTDNHAGDVGGALFPFESETTITNTVFSGNGGYDGGAIFSQEGTLVLSGSTLTENIASGHGGGLFVHGTPAGGAGDDVVIRDSVFSRNQVTDNPNGKGGGTFFNEVEDGILIERTTLSGNLTRGGAGGIGQVSEADSALTIRDSTFSGNQGDADEDDDGAGGGLEFQLGGPLTITNSTFSGNSANAGGGIAAYNYHDEPVSITNSTIVGNSGSVEPTAGGGLYSYGYDRPSENGNDTITLSSSIVAANSGPGDPDIGGNYSGDLQLAVGFSLLGTNPVVAPTVTGPNLTGVDPQLGPLQNNGGATLTHAPALTSPVIDKGVGNGLATDQRGTQRTFDAANVANATGGDGTDIGAVELLPGNRLAAAQCKGKTENLLFAPGTAIVGTDANDVIVGTPANDQISSGKGKDTVCAQGGNDSVRAGAGKDNASGQAGKDRLKGKGGNDRLQGNAGRDTLKGGGGKDTLKGGGGKDKLRGGPGRDKLRGGGGKDSERQ